MRTFKKNDEMEFSIWTRKYGSVHVIIKYSEVEQPLGFFLRPRERSQVKEWLGRDDLDSILDSIRKPTDIPYDYCRTEISLYDLIVLREKFAEGMTEEQMKELNEFCHCIFCEVLPEVYEDIEDDCRKFLRDCEAWQLKLEILREGDVKHEMSVLREEYSEHLREKKKKMKKWEELMAESKKTKESSDEKVAIEREMYELKEPIEAVYDEPEVTPPEGYVDEKTGLSF